MDRYTLGCRWELPGVLAWSLQQIVCNSQHPVMCFSPVCLSRLSTASLLVLRSLQCLDAPFGVPQCRARGIVLVLA